ncbi:MAG: sigma-70 family RNA polymerase sigma factor [Planctomycetes bacterium]|nr:sigma-70 family RNA polymerase sigma factor [Planctomycetota bacterium]
MESGAAVPGGEAVRVLVENHRAFLRFLERRVGSRETAEDLLQEAFGRALPKVATIRKSESAVAWFYRVLRNAIIDHRRRRAAGDRALEAFARELEDPAEGSETLEEVCACVGRLAGTLKPEYAEALQRIEVEGMAVKEFAASRGLTAGNAAVRVHRAREALRKRVLESCGTCAEHGCLDCRCGAGGK